MAIERANELSETDEVSAEVVSDGIDLDPELLGGNMDVEEGDVVRIVVVKGIDPETGMWRGKYADAAPENSAIDEMATSYKSPKEMEI